MPIPFTCLHCGHQTSVDEYYSGQTGPCGQCGKMITIPGAPAVANVRRPEDDPAIRMLIPVGRSPLAIAAGYMGLFSLLLFPAPIALILGLLAIRDIRAHPEKHGMGRAIFGLVMGILFTVPLILAIFGMIVAEFNL